MTVVSALERIEARLGSMDERLGSMDARLVSMDGRLQAVVAMAGTQIEELRAQRTQFTAEMVALRESGERNFEAHRREMRSLTERSDMLTDAVLRTLERLDGPEPGQR